MTEDKATPTLAEQQDDMLFMLRHFVVTRAPIPQVLIDDLKGYCVAHVEAVGSHYTIEILPAFEQAWLGLIADEQDALAEDDFELKLERGAELPKQ